MAPNVRYMTELVPNASILFGVDIVEVFVWPKTLPCSESFSQDDMFTFYEKKYEPIPKLILKSVLYIFMW